MAAPIPFYDRILDDLREKDTGYGTLGNPFPATGWYAYNTSGALELVTIDATNHLVITPVVSSNTGSPIGLLLALTYA